MGGQGYRILLRSRWRWHRMGMLLHVHRPVVGHLHDAGGTRLRGFGAGFWAFGSGGRDDLRPRNQFAMATGVPFGYAVCQCVNLSSARPVRVNSFRVDRRIPLAIPQIPFGVAGAVVKCIRPKAGH